MKLLYTSLILILLNTNIFADITCESGIESTSKDLDLLSSNVKDIDCNVINKMNNCSEVHKIDSNYLNQLTSTFDLINNTMSEKGEGYAHLKFYKTGSSHRRDLAKVFDVNYKDPYRFESVLRLENGNQQVDLNYDNYKKLATQREQAVVSPLHTFMNVSKSADQYEKIKNAVARNMATFNEKYNCNKRVNIINLPRNLGVPKDLLTSRDGSTCFESEQAARKAFQSKKAEIDKYMKENYSQDEMLNQNLSCSDRVNFRNWNVQVKQTKSCAGKFSSYFPDNQWEINNVMLSEDPAYKEFQNCIEDMKAKGLKLSKVNISSSSSQLNNTGAAKDEFCGKGFERLSKARAASAKGILQDRFGFEDKDFSISYKGQNGNGSSGECPYEMKNGVERLKPEFAPGGSKRKDLDDSKYVKVSVTFEPKIERGPKTKTCFQPTYYCSRIGYKCEDWSTYQPNWPRPQK